MPCRLTTAMLQLRVQAPLNRSTYTYKVYQIKWRSHISLWPPCQVHHHFRDVILMMMIYKIFAFFYIESHACGRSWMLESATFCKPSPKPQPPLSSLSPAPDIHPSTFLPSIQPQTNPISSHPSSTTRTVRVEHGGAERISQTSGEWCRWMGLQVVFRLWLNRLDHLIF